MPITDIPEAESNLSKLIEQSLRGEDVIIARAGRPVVRLVAIPPDTSPRVDGEDTRWYLADLVLENRIEGDPRNVIHINTHLIEAASPEMAYRKAVDLGRAGEMEYENTNDKLVRCIFRGIRNLEVIQDDPEDGAELFYDEHIGIAEDEIRGWVKSKDELSVFAPREKQVGVPNYMPRSIAEDLVAEGVPRTEIMGWEHESPGAAGETEERS